jgi:hypothetical protein
VTTMQIPLKFAVVEEAGATSPPPSPSRPTVRRRRKDLAATRPRPRQSLGAVRGLPQQQIGERRATSTPPRNRLRIHLRVCTPQRDSHVSATDRAAEPCSKPRPVPSSSAAAEQRSAPRECGWGRQAQAHADGELAHPTRLLARRRCGGDGANLSTTSWRRSAPTHSLRTRGG